MSVCERARPPALLPAQRRARALRGVRGAQVKLRDFRSATARERELLLQAGGGGVEAFERRLAAEEDQKRDAWLAEIGAWDRAVQRPRTHWAAGRQASPAGRGIPLECLF